MLYNPTNLWVEKPKSTAIQQYIRMNVGTSRLRLNANANANANTVATVTAHITLQCDYPKPPPNPSTPCLAALLR